MSTPSGTMVDTVNRFPFPPVETLADVVSNVARVDADRVALGCVGVSLTYGELERRIERAACGLAAIGVGHGDRVAILLPNGLEFPVALFGSLRLGAIVVPVSPFYRSEEIAYAIGDSGASVLISHADWSGQVAWAIASSPTLRHHVVVGLDATDGASTAWGDLVAMADARPPVRVEPGAIALLCYTSGTTGRPKGAMLTHRNLAATLRGNQAVPRLAVREDDRVLCPLPLFHIFGLNLIMAGTLAFGAAIFVTVRFDAEEALATIERDRITRFVGVPPMYVAFTSSPSLERHDLSSLRLCGSGAAALPVAVLDRFRAATGITIMEGYGLTETAGFGTLNAVGPVSKPGTIGPPVPGMDTRFVDDEGRDVPRGEPGELLMRGESVFVGYWNRPEATAEAIRDGWFHTGDVVTVDADGYLTIVDRKKDMINVGGLKVWPREVEEVLYRHPAVREAAVVAAADAYAGERPLAFVVLREGERATAAAIVEHAAEHLARFKVPVRVEFRGELPKLPSGKVLRRALREETASTSADA